MAMPQLESKEEIARAKAATDALARAQAAEEALAEEKEQREEWQEGEEFNWNRANRAEQKLDRILSAAKQWRNATESRLRLTDSRGEAAKSMLKPDADFIATLDSIQGKED